MVMNRRNFIRASAGCVAASTLPAAPARKPNIVLIVADDQGYAEMGVQGCRDVPTPHLDSIAAAGVRFTSGYVSCPVCSPTRAGLATGRYQQRFGHEFNPGPAAQADDVFGLALTETTLATRLKSLGYATGMFGKWHLGYRPEYHPMKRGFDEFMGFLGGAHSYLDPLGDQANPVMRGTQPWEEKEYLTDALGREAVSFIERKQKEPFFLYLPFNAVHAPLQSIEKYLARFTAIRDERRRTFAAMLSAMDENIGRVLAKLRETKLDKDTLVLFVSDNGGPTPNTTSRNDPLRGYKGQVLEGGIRVPYLMRWTGRIPAGKVYDKPVISLDFHPTAVAAAGGTIPAGLKMDGVNLLPYLTGANSGAPHESLCWRFGEQSAIRMGDWKLASLAGSPPELYNLAEDIGEKNNLATAQPAKLKELQAAWEAWNKEMIPPKWGRPDRRRGRAAQGAGAGRQRRKKD